MAGRGRWRIESRRRERLYANRFSAPSGRPRPGSGRTLCDGVLPAATSRPTATVLDVGAGYCDFINQVRAARRIAVDLNPDTRPVRGRRGSRSIDLPLERLGEAIEPESVDLAFASNVFEHLRGPDALLEVLAAIRAVAPAGRAADRHAAERPGRRRRVLGLLRPHPAR